MSDVRWELVQPVLTARRSECRGRGVDIGRPPDHDRRSLLDAVPCVNRTGIPWCYPARRTCLQPCQRVGRTFRVRVGVERWKLDQVE
ncbi:transposase [Streptomyces sp. NPDC001185]|uniref:transposase n=1 Tax=Streptomyces sp. NPDC001185 TaxID=3154380 RepID=UPI00332792AC